MECVSKIVTTRLQKVVATIVCQAQVGYVPGRQLVENVLLATKLVKGYGRGFMSPRCMQKIDLRKAYDSLS